MKFEDSRPGIASTVSPRGALEGLWELAGCDREVLDRIELRGDEPALPSVFPVGTAASACIGVAGLAASDLWRLRTGVAQPVRVAMRDAAIAYRSEQYLRLDGASVEGPHRAQSYFRDASDRWMQLHMVYAHHRDGILAELGCDDDEAAIARAVADTDALVLEDALAAKGLPGYALRTRGEWMSHPQAAALATVPAIRISRLGDAAPRPLPAGDRPLAGIRIADLTRVIAGPVCGRTLAAHGAEVLRIHPPHLPELPVLVMDGGRGKRCANVDLRVTDHRRDFDALLDGADVFVQGFRPGAAISFGYALSATDPDITSVANRLERRHTDFGTVTSVRCAEELPATPPGFSLPCAPLGSHRCEWL